MEIYIVTSKDIINQFKNAFKEFTVDLGKSFTAAGKIKDPKQSMIDIKDEFIINFINENSKFCYKMGSMGSINFYVFPEIEQQIWVYAKMEKLVFPCRKGTKINTNFLGSILIEMENRLSSSNPNTFTNTIQNYYNKKNLSGSKPGNE